MNRLPANRWKKSLAVLAMVLMLHTQAVWACDGLVTMDQAPCCGEHGSDVMVMGHDPNCEGDLSAKASCAKPFASTVGQVLIQNPHDAGDDDGDPHGHHGHGSLVAIALLADAFPPYTGPPARVALSDPCQALALARLTYLTTLRLRI